VLLPHQQSKLARGTEDKEHAMSQQINAAIAVIGIDIGKNSFHIVGLDRRGTAPWQELSDVAAALVRCGHVSGLLMRQVWPLALMLCADRVPIESTHLEVR
jgi:hypothetical protein